MKNRSTLSIFVILSSGAPLHSRDATLAVMSIRKLLCSLILAYFLNPFVATPAAAQVQGAATVSTGAACTAGWFAWPDASGQPVQCSGGVWTAISDTLWSVSGSNIYYNAGSVGIGTATPGAELNVYNAGGGTSFLINGGNGTGDTNQGAQYEMTNLNAAAGVRNKYFRVDNAGNFDILNSGYSAGLLTVSDGGAATWTGSNSATAFIPTGSTVPTNGMYLPAANAVAIAVNSTNVMNVISTGIGIGTTSPAGTLDVYGASSYFGTAAGGSRINGRGPDSNAGIWLQYTDGNSYYDSALNTYFRVNGNAGLATAMFLASSGNVGIGTATPGVNLDVSADQQNTTIRVTGAGTITPYLISRRAMGSIASPTVIDVAGRGLFDITAQGYDGSVYGSGAQIAFQADGTWSTSSYPSNVLFFTAPSGSTTLTERMRITSGGYVGIGTTTPGAKLDIAAGASHDIFIGQDSGNTNYNVISLNGNAGEPPNSLGLTGGNSIDPSLYVDALSSGSIVVRPNGQTGAPNAVNLVTFSGSQTTFMNGDVGIGTTTPAQMLSVNGTALANNYYVTAAVGDGIGFWAGPPSTYGIFFSNSASYQYGGVTDYYIANVVSSGTGRGFVWSYGTSPSMALNASTGNLAITGTLTVNGTGNSYIAGKVGIGTTGPTYPLVVQTGSAVGTNDEIVASPTSTVLGSGSGILFGATFSDTWGGTDYGTRYSGAIRYLPNNSDVYVAGAARNHRLGFFTVALNAGTDTPVEQMSIQSNGYVGIGTTTPSSTLEVYSNSSATTGNVYATLVTGSQTTANTGGYASINANPLYTAASGNTLANLVGMYATPENTSTGTVSSMYSFAATPENTSTGTVTNMFGIAAVAENLSTGSVGSMYGLYGQCQNNNASGVVTSCYELYLATPITTGAITNKYGVYQADSASANYFNGKVGIGTTGPNAKLAIVNNVSSGGPGGAYGNYQIILYDSGAANTSYGLGIEGNNMWLNSGNTGYKFYVGGTIEATINATGAYTDVSDRRLKTDIQPLSEANGLSAIMRLQPVTFRWKDVGKSGTGEHIGFIAQDVEQVLPQLVSKIADSSTITLPDGSKQTVSDTKGIDYADMVVPIVKAMQELKSLFDGDHEQIARLKADNNKQQAQIEADEKEVVGLTTQLAALQQKVSKLVSTHAH